MHQTEKSNQYYFAVRAHGGVDAESGLVHVLVGTAANLADVTQVDHLLHFDQRKSLPTPATRVWNAAANTKAARRTGTSP